MTIVENKKKGRPLGYSPKKRAYVKKSQTTSAFGRLLEAVTILNKAKSTDADVLRATNLLGSITLSEISS